MKTSRPNHLKGHSSGYSKTLIQLQSIGRVTFEVKVKSTKNYNYIPSFKNMLYKNDVMWKQADLTTSKDTLLAIQKHYLRSNPLFGWPLRSRSKEQKNYNYALIFKNMLHKNVAKWKQADLANSKNTLQAIQKHHLRSNPLVGWPLRSRSKVQKIHKYVLIFKN